MIKVPEYVTKLVNNQPKTNTPETFQEFGTQVNEILQEFSGGILSVDFLYHIQSRLNNYFADQQCLGVFNSRIMSVVRHSLVTENTYSYTEACTHAENYSHFELHEVLHNRKLKRFEVIDRLNNETTFINYYNQENTLEVTFYDDTQAFYNLEEVWKTSNPWRFRHE